MTTMLRAVRHLRVPKSSPALLLRGLALTVEPTPNPKSMKFILEEGDVLGQGTKTLTYRDINEANSSQLASTLLQVEGVREVMLAAQHVTVTKGTLADWDELSEVVVQEIKSFYEAGHRPVDEGVTESTEPKDFEEGSLEFRIVELLEERVKPFVQQDGGDVEFERFDHHDSTLYVKMMGSCSGCSQSHATLQEGVKNLMDHYIPEVKHIVGLNDEVEEDLPRPGWR